MARYRHHSHKHKNLLLLVLGLIFAYFISQDQSFRSFLLSLGSLGYLGAFIGGLLWVSTFTMAIGIVILVVLAKQLPFIQLGVVAVLGAVIGDFLIFYFVKDDLTNEIRPIYNKLGGKHLTKVLHTKYFSWTLPVIGALIIALPLPDELGVSLMGLSQMKALEFFLVSLLSHTTGIFLIISTSFFS